MDIKTKESLLKSLDDLVVKARRDISFNRSEVKRLAETQRILKRKLTELENIKNIIIKTEVKKVAISKSKK